MAFAAPLAAGAGEAAAGSAAASASSGAAAGTAARSGAAGASRAGGASSARGSAGRSARTTSSRGSSSATSVNPAEVAGSAGPLTDPPGGDGGDPLEGQEASSGSTDPSRSSSSTSSSSDAFTRAVRRAQPSQQVAGGLLAALVVYPVLLNFLQGGSPQVKRWFRAKFLNRVGNESSSSTTGVANASLGGAKAGATIVNASSSGTSSGGSGSSANAPPSTAGSSKAAIAIAFARAQIGLPYVWGGNGPPKHKGFDCSGLTKKAFEAAGVTLPRVTTLQILAGKGVKRADLQPGDLVFPNPRHVGIYTGNGMFIEAPRTGLNVREVKVWGFLTARRVV